MNKRKLRTQIFDNYLDLYRAVLWSTEGKKLNSKEIRECIRKAFDSYCQNSRGKEFGIYDFFSVSQLGKKFAQKVAENKQKDLSKNVLSEPFSSKEDTIQSGTNDRLKKVLLKRCLKKQLEIFENENKKLATVLSLSKTRMPIEKIAALFAGSVDEAVNMIHDAKTQFLRFAKKCDGFVKGN